MLDVFQEKKNPTFLLETELMVAVAHFHYAFIFIISEKNEYKNSCVSDVIKRPYI